MKVRTLHRPECPDLPAIPRNVELQGFVLENVLNGSPGPNTTSTNMGTSRKTGQSPRLAQAIVVEKARVYWIACSVPNSPSASSLKPALKKSTFAGAVELPNVIVHRPLIESTLPFASSN